VGFPLRANALRQHFLVSTLLFIALIVGPVRQLNFFSDMPGDLIDPRLNNYFLENIYLYLTGNSHSLIHLDFFYPYPFVSGFSDNLLGAFPIYFVARVLTSTPEDAFQAWFIIGYIANFIAAFWAIRIFKQSPPASLIGALFFTFGLPVVAQMGHAQLQYRFGIPLAIVFFYQFLTQYCWRSLLASIFWLVWQFYCSIYLGFFVSLFMFVMMITLIFKSSFQISNFTSIFHGVDQLKNFYYSFKDQDIFNKIKFLVILSIFLLMIVILFYPYLKVTALYHFTRSWVEVSAMSPRLSSYFLADNSLIWGGISRSIKEVPIRWEQQLFIGFVPIIIFVTAFINRSKGLVYQSYLPWFAVSLLINNDTANQGK